MTIPTEKPKDNDNRAGLYSIDDYVEGENVGLLIAMLRQRLVSSFDESLSDLSLTGAQLQIMQWIIKHPGQTTAQMCRDINMDTGSMKRMLDRIEKKGFIRRVPSDMDRRAIGLEITAAGLALWPTIVPRVVDNLNRYLKGFSPDEIRQLQSMLKRMLDNA